MRHLQRLPLLLISTALLALTAHAQPQWRFHLAFEDGAGARDTLWFIYDTTATMTSSGNVDYELGEGAVEMNDGAFHVFTRNAHWDSTKTVAWPYSWYPHMGTPSVEAINWVPPMTLRWDTSLFHAPYLPYEQGSFGKAVMLSLGFYANSNDPILGGYNMLIDDSVTIIEFWDYIFPFQVIFGGYDGVGVPEEDKSSRFHPWPNPATTTLYIAMDGIFRSLSILDLSGRMVGQFDYHPASDPIDIGHLHPGRYIVQIMTEDGAKRHASFVKYDP